MTDITPVRCTVPGCLWAVHGIPDQYDAARSEAVARHLAEQHAEPIAEAADTAPLTDGQLASIRAVLDDPTYVKARIANGHVYADRLLAEVDRLRTENTKLGLLVNVWTETSRFNSRAHGIACDEVKQLRAEVRTLTAVAESNARAYRIAVEESERHHAELTARRTEGLTLRGTLAPADSPRRVPMPLGESLVPAIEWLLTELATAEARINATPTPTT